MAERDRVPLADSPAATIRRRGRRRRRTVQAVVLVSAMLIGVAAVRGAELWADQPDPGPVRPAPTTPVAPATTMAPTTPSTAPATTGEPATTGAVASRTPTLRPDGLAVVAFGASERAARSALQRRLGPPDERGSWDAATPFGTCPGPVRAVRWGRLYVLFTNGPTRYVAGGRWHLFAYRVDAIQRTAVDPQHSGSPPPDPPPLRGASPRTAAGVGFGSTLAELRVAYGSRVSTSFGEPGMIHRFRVGFGAAGELSGSLSGSSPGATVTGIGAGQGCGE